MANSLFIKAKDHTVHPIKRVHGRDFNIRIEGTGEPLLFVHGFPLDHTMWKHQIACFAKTNQVIAPDLRGFGASSGGEDPGDVVTMGEFATDLSSLLVELSIHEPVHFCGLSMGGYIAWQFFEEHHPQLKSFILCDTKASADSEEAKQARIDTAEKVLREGPEFLAVAMVEKLFSTRTLNEQPKTVEEVQETIRTTSPKSIAAALRGMAARPDMSELLKDIDVPTLVIVGEDDALTTPQEMQLIAETIPHARFTQIAGAGHMSPLEKPDEANQAISDFLSNLD
jgi:3-oxoadipate enol-lactonase